MSNIRIITDSASDISYKDEQELNIKILNFKIAMGDESYISRVDFDNEKFYELLKGYDGIPATSQVTPFEFEELYEEQYEEGYTDLILVLINSKGSATYNNAVFAKKNFFEEHPELEGKMNIQLFDGASYSGAYGYPAIMAARMAKEGKSADDIVAMLGEVLPKQRIYFGIYELKYAAKSGRIPSAAALVGDVVGIKPIMKIWDGEITTASKCRGEKKLITNIVKVTKEEMVPGSKYTIVYGNDENVKEELIKKMTEEVGYPPEMEFQIGAAIAVNAGPRVVGTIFEANV